MNASAIATPAAATSTATTTKSSNSTLDTQSFLKLLTAQMANQNPLEPVKDTEYFAQLAQLGTVQGIDALKTSMAVTQAQSLMGRQVTASYLESGQPKTITGTVMGSSTSNGDVSVTIAAADGTTATVTIDKLVATGAASTGLADYSSLIGNQGVGGGTINGVPATVSGQIVGVSVVNGHSVARIQTAANGVVNVGVETLTQVGA